MAVLQGVLLGVLPLAMGLWRIPHIVLMAAAAVAVKGWLIPYLFRRALQPGQDRPGGGPLHRLLRLAAALRAGHGPQPDPGPQPAP